MKQKVNKTVKANKATSSSGLDSLVCGIVVAGKFKNVSERRSVNGLHKLIRVVVFASRVLEVFPCYALYNPSRDRGLHEEIPRLDAGVRSNIPCKLSQFSFSKNRCKMRCSHEPFSLSSCPPGSCTDIHLSLNCDTTG